MVVYGTKLKKKGFFNYVELYTFCFNFWLSRNYLLKEKKYVEIVTDFGKEIKLEWEITQIVNDYFKNVVSLKWHILGMNDAEIEQGGQKVKTNKGEVKIEISADLKDDYSGKWKKNPILKRLHSVYHNQVIYPMVEDYEDRLRDDALDFVDEAKSFLEI